METRLRLHFSSLQDTMDSEDRLSNCPLLGVSRHRQVLVGLPGWALAGAVAFVYELVVVVMLVRVVMVVMVMQGDRGDYGDAGDGGDCKNAGDCRAARRNGGSYGGGDGEMVPMMLLPEEVVVVMVAMATT